MNQVTDIYQGVTWLNLTITLILQMLILIDYQPNINKLILLIQIK